MVPWSPKNAAEKLKTIQNVKLNRRFLQPCLSKCLQNFTFFIPLVSYFPNAASIAGPNPDPPRILPPTFFQQLLQY